MTVLPIAALQISSLPGDQEGSLAKLVEMVHGVKVAFPHVKMVIAPEQFLSAPLSILHESREDIERTAVEIPGPLTDRLAQLAAETSLWLVPGSVYERTVQGIYNTALVLSPNQGLVATYRKVFPWHPYETVLAGSEFVCFDMPGVARIGLAICYDGAFPETYRQLAWLGAEIVIQPTLTPTVDRASELVMARANAMANQFFVITVNSGAPAGAGQTAVIDPEGIVRSLGGPNEQIVTDVIDVGATRRVRTYGSHGLSRMWAQVASGASQPWLPAYGGSFAPSPTHAVTLTSEVEGVTNARK